MSPRAADAIVLALAAYAAVGLLFAVAFSLRGAGRLNPDARDGSAGFRVIIVPAAAALWPLLLVRWARAPRASSAHPPERREA